MKSYELWKMYFQKMLYDFAEQNFYGCTKQVVFLSISLYTSE